MWVEKTLGAIRWWSANVDHAHSKFMLSAEMDGRWSVVDWNHSEDATVANGVADSVDAAKRAATSWLRKHLEALTARLPD